MHSAVKPLSGEEFSYIIDYFLSLSPEDDLRMGIDRKALPRREVWLQMLINDSQEPLQKRRFYYLGWQLDDQFIGHCGINNIHYGQEASIHLHIWSPCNRQKGLGTKLFKESLRFYFDKFALHKIICEPNVDNPCPNRALQKLGLKVLSSYLTKPSILNYEHQVNRYEIYKSTTLW